MPRRRTTRAQMAGRDRAACLARRLRTSLRDRRLAARLTQQQVADRAGLSQTEISRLERGRAIGSGIDEWAAVGAAVGLQVAAFFEGAAGADAPRDLEHLRRQSLVVRISRQGGWTAFPEASLGDDGPWSRSIDVLLGRAARHEAAVVEIWDLLLDGGQAMRGIDGIVGALARRVDRSEDGDARRLGPPLDGRPGHAPGCGPRQSMSSRRDHDPDLLVV